MAGACARVEIRKNYRDITVRGAELRWVNKYFEAYLVVLPRKRP
jgi:hypothetical protein